jgi:hypothetical protein
MSTNDEQREPSVLADLPRARPQLRSERRGSAKPRKPAPAKRAATAKAADVAKAAAKPKPAATKPRKTAPAKPGPTTTTSPPPSDDQPFVATALQAAGELAQIGIAVGVRAVRNALDRLPKP